MRIAILGATSAIAHSAAKVWAQYGHEFVLVGRNTERLQSIGQDLRSHGASAVECITADLAVMSHHQALTEALWQKPLDILFVAFGTLTDQKRAEADPVYAVEQINNNFTAVASLLLYSAKHFQQQKSGVISVIGSVAGDRGRRSNGVYGSTKAGLESFLSGLRGSFAGTDVLVQTIKPGWVDTPMTSHLKKGLLFASSDAVGAGIVKAIFKKRQVVYLPWFWKVIMTILDYVPEKLFHKLPF